MIRQSIVNKIVVLALVVTLTAVFVSNFFISSYLMNAYYEQAEQKNRAYLNSIVESFEQDLSSIESAVYGVRHAIEVEEIIELSHVSGGLTQYEGELIKHFSRILSSKDRVSDSVYLYLSPYLDDDVHDVWMTNENSVLKRHDEVPLERYINNDNMSWYYVPQSHGEGLWLEPYRNRYDQLVSSFVVPIFRGDEYLGMLGMYLSFERAESLIQDRKGYVDDAILIVNSKGNVLNTLDDSKNSELYINSDQYASYQSETYNGWSFQYYVNRSEIEALRHDIEERVLWTLVIVTFIVLVTAQFFRKRYKEIFEDISVGIEHLKRGEYDYVVRVKTEDELGEIAKALNLASKEIEKYSEELEKIVTERTVLLKYTNEELEKSVSSLKETNEALNTSKKKERMSKFIIEIAHRMNTPIGNAKTSISYLESIKSKAKDKLIHASSDLAAFSSNMEQAIQIVASDVEEIADIVSGLQLLSLESARIVKSKINMENLMNYTLQSHVTDIGAKKKFTYNVESVRRSDVYSSQLHITEIMRNLLKYSEGYSVKADAVHINILIKRVDHTIEIEYKDNSGLFFSEVGSFAFEPFVLNTFEKGISGLELVMVYNLVTAGLGGEIECLEGEAGRPFFRIRIPIA